MVPGRRGVQGLPGLAALAFWSGLPGLWPGRIGAGGVSALKMQKLLGLGSYQTAWAMLHRYRTAMV